MKFTVLLKKFIMVDCVKPGSSMEPIALSFWGSKINSSLQLVIYSILFE